MIDLNTIENEMRVEEKFKYKGYNCIITLSDYGWRCGYIILPNSHPLAHKELHELTDIECHGGINYSDNTHSCFNLDGIGGGWIIGFSFDHFKDEYDLQAVKQVFGEKAYREALEYMKNPVAIECHKDGRPVTTEIVKEEIQKVIDQIDNKS